jgi:hypothetical protein
MPRDNHVHDVSWFWYWASVGCRKSSTITRFTGLDIFLDNSVGEEVGEMSETVSAVPRSGRTTQDSLKRQDVVILSYMPISGGKGAVYEVRDLLPEEARMLFDKTRRQMKETLANIR